MALEREEREREEERERYKTRINRLPCISFSVVHTRSSLSPPCGIMLTWLGLYVVFSTRGPAILFS